MMKLFWVGAPWISGKAYYLDDGIIVTADFSRDRWYRNYECNEELRTRIRKLGYDSVVMGDDFVERALVAPCVGRDMDYFDRNVKKNIELMNKRRNKRRDDEESWEKLRERFGGFVIGMDNEVDVFPTGFNVRMLFRTDKTFDERKQFVEDNLKEIVKYAIEELQNQYRTMGKIGDMRYYKPVLVTPLRSMAEAEIKFEVKGNLQDGK